MDAGQIGAAGARSAAERRALGAFDLDGLVGLLRELIGIPSLDGAESAAQRAVAGWMERAGLDTDVWDIDLDEVARHPAFGAEVERSEALGVVGWVGTGVGGRDLLLNGHIDVVPPGPAAEWTGEPFTAAVRDGRVVGRGAADMKGGLCCALFAAKAVRESGVRLCGRLSVASVVGEEDGGTGTLATLLRGHTADGAVVTEPTALAVVPAQAGSLMFRLVVPGRAAHGCLREEGVSAVEKLPALLDALRTLEAERCGLVDGAAAVAGEPRHPYFARYRLPWPIEIGVVRAGDWPSSVPGRLVAEGRFGVAVGEQPAAARRALEEAVARVAAADPWLSRHPPLVEWWGGVFEPAAIDEDDPVVTTLAAAMAASGRTATVEGVTYGSDMRLLVHVGGIPTVLFGPGDVREAHAPDESIAVDELCLATQTLILAALRYCGVDE